MVYKGYELTGAAADLLSVPRYGAGSLVLHRAVFALVPPDHRALVATHTLASVVSLLLLPAGLSYLLGRRPERGTAVVVAAFGLALLPQLVVDARSESILTLGVAVLGVAWLGFAAWWEGQGGGRALAVVALAVALAATIRPELLVLGPAWLAAHAWVRRDTVGADVDRRARWRALAAALAAGAVLLVPHLLHLRATTAEQVATGALPPLDGRAVLRTVGVMAGGSALFRPAIFPTFWLALLLFWAAPSLRAHGARASLAMLALAVLATGLVAIDLPDVSLPRLHAAAAALAVLGLAPAAVAAFARLRRRLPTAAAIGLLLTAAVASAVPSWQARRAPTDEDAEDALARLAEDAMPARGGCLLRLDDGDPPPQRVHRHFPDYRFLPPVRQARVLPLRAFRDRGALAGCERVVAVLGTRCWLHARDDADRAGMLPLCAEVAALPGAEERFTTTLPVRGTDGFGWAPQRERWTLRLVALPTR